MENNSTNNTTNNTTNNSTNKNKMTDKEYEDYLKSCSTGEVIKICIIAVILQIIKFFVPILIICLFVKLFTILWGLVFTWKIALSIAIILELLKIFFLYDSHKTNK